MRITVNEQGIITHSDNKQEISVDINLDINSDIDFTNANIIGLNQSGSGQTGATGLQGNAGPTGPIGATGAIDNITNLSFAGTLDIGPTITAGSNQGNATHLPTGKFAYVCRSDSLNKGIALTTGHVILGLNFIVINDDFSNNDFKLYPPPGGKLNDVNIDAHINVQAGKTLMLTCFNATPGASRWSVIGL